MPITPETKRRLLSFKEKLRVVELMREDAAADNVIEVDTIISYVGSIAHRLGRDSSNISDSTVTSIARELGITLRTRHAMSLPQAVARITVLEEIVQRLSDGLIAVNKRYDELEAAYLENRAPRAVGHDVR